MSSSTEKIFIWLLVFCSVILSGYVIVFGFGSQLPYDLSRETVRDNEMIETIADTEVTATAEETVTSTIERLFAQIPFYTITKVEPINETAVIAEVHILTELRGNANLRQFDTGRASLWHIDTARNTGKIVFEAELHPCHDLSWSVRNGYLELEHSVSPCEAGFTVTSRRFRLQDRELDEVLTVELSSWTKTVQIQKRFNQKIYNDLSVSLATEGGECVGDEFTIGPGQPLSLPQTTLVGISVNGKLHPLPEPTTINCSVKYGGGLESPDLFAELKDNTVILSILLSIEGDPVPLAAIDLLEEDKEGYEVEWVRGE